MPKRFIFLALAACALYGLAGATSLPDGNSAVDASDGRSWQIKLVEINNRVIPNGSLAVGEAIEVKFDGNFTGFYRDIPLFPDQQIDNLKVGDSQQQYRQEGSAVLGSFGPPGTWAQDRPSKDAFRIVWHHQTSYQKRTFTTGYTLSNAGERFQDGDVVRIRVWGQYWDSSVDRLRMVLTLPTKAKAKISAGPAWLDPVYRQQGQKITLTANKIPANQELDFLAVLPRGSLGPNVKEKSGSLPKIKQSLADKAYTSFAASKVSRFLIYFFGLLLIGFGGALAWIFYWKRRCQDQAYTSDGLVYDPPAGQSLVMGYAAAEEKNPRPDRAVVATLIDLIARGYYKRENVRDQAGNWRLEIALPEARDPNQTVTNAEAAVIKYFDNLLVAGPCIIDNLDSRVKASKTDQNRYLNMIGEINKESNVARQGQVSRSWTAKPPAIIWVLIVAWLISFLIVPSGVGSPATFLVALLVAALTIVAVITWPRGDFVRSGTSAMQSAGPWRSWRDFILNFSSMETAPDLQVILWERAFAGALLYGVAQEFTDRAKVLVPNLPDDTTTLAGATFYSASLGSSLSSSSTPPSSSSGGGSSFGGGGGFSGGGSGGGGGGAW